MTRAFFAQMQNALSFLKDKDCREKPAGFPRHL